MLKAASVELASSVIKLDGGVVSVMVRGDVSSVRAAVEAGAEAAGRVGELAAAHVIPAARPGRRPCLRRRQAAVKVLVANLGSTSFKYRLFDLSDPAEPVLARGAIERIGSPNAKVVIKSARGERELVAPIADHGEAVQLCLDQLTDPEIGVLHDAAEVAAIGFKAVHARNLTGVHLVDDDGAGRDGGLRRRRARAQSALHQGDADAPRPASRSCRWSPPSRPASTGRSPRPTSATPSPMSGRPSSASAAGGSTAPATATSPSRMPELLGRSRHQGDLVPPGRQLVALCDPKRPVGRVQPGDEPAVRPAAQQPRGRFRRLRPAGHPARDRQDPRRGARHPGQPVGPGRARAARAATSATSRPPRQPATPGPSWPSTSSSPRSAITSAPISLELGGADAIVFTGGIGENSVADPHRASAATWTGSASSSTRLATQAGPAERLVSTPGSRVQVWTVPTNEEIVVARQAKQLLEQTTQEVRSRCSWPE